MRIERGCKAQKLDWTHPCVYIARMINAVSASQFAFAWCAAVTRSIPPGGTVLPPADVVCRGAGLRCAVSGRRTSLATCGTSVEGRDVKTQTQTRQTGIELAVVVSRELEGAQAFKRGESKGAAALKIES